MSDTLYGFIGLGNMGHPIAKRLLDTGHKLHVTDINPAAVQQFVAYGAMVHDTAQGVGDAADVVFLSLPDGKVVEKVLAGDHGLAQGRRVKCVVDLSTIGPEAAQRAFGILAEKDIDYVDAPVAGGTIGAERGSLTMMVACKASRYDELLSTLGYLGKPFYLGAKAGQGQIMKLTNNLMWATAAVITSEALVLGVKAGLDPSIMIDILNVSSGRNAATLGRFAPSVLAGSFNVGFAAGLAHKDLRLCLDEADRHHVPMMVGSSVREMLALTAAVHGENADYSNIVRIMENWAGIEVRAKKQP